MKYLKLGVLILLVLSIPLIGSFASFDLISNNINVVDAISVAVVNEDAGATFNEESVNFGQQFVQQFEKNDAYNFTIVSMSVAEKGLKDGSFDVMINIPNNFTEKSLAAYSTDPEYVKLYYKTSPTQSYLEKTNGERCISDLQSLMNQKVVEVYIVSMIKNIQDAQEEVNLIIGNEEDYLNLLLGENYPALKSLCEKWGVVNTRLSPLESSLGGAGSSSTSLTSMLENNKTTIEKFQTDLTEITKKQDENANKLNGDKTQLEEFNNSLDIIQEAVGIALNENISIKNRLDGGEDSLLASMKSYKDSIVAFKSKIVDFRDGIKNTYEQKINDNVLPFEDLSEFEDWFKGNEGPFKNLDNYVQDRIDEFTVQEGEEEQKKEEIKIILEEEDPSSIYLDLKELIEECSSVLKDYIRDSLLTSYGKSIQQGNLTNVEKDIGKYIEYLADQNSTGDFVWAENETFSADTSIPAGTFTTIANPTITLSNTSSSATGIFSEVTISGLDETLYTISGLNTSSVTINFLPGADLSQVTSVSYKYTVDQGTSNPSEIGDVEINIKIVDGTNTTFIKEKLHTNGKYASDMLTQEYFNRNTKDLYNALRNNTGNEPISSFMKNNQNESNLYKALQVDLFGDELLEKVLDSLMDFSAKSLVNLFESVQDEIVHAKDDIYDFVTMELKKLYMEYTESYTDFETLYNDCITQFNNYEAALGDDTSGFIGQLTNMITTLEGIGIDLGLNNGEIENILNDLNDYQTKGGELLTATIGTTLTEKGELDKIQYSLSERGEGISSSSQSLHETSKSQSEYLETIYNSAGELVNSANAANQQGNSAVTSLSTAVDQWSDVIDNHNGYKEEFEKVFAHSKVESIDDTNLFSAMASPVDSENLSLSDDLSKSVFPFFLIILILISGIFTSYVFTNKNTKDKLENPYEDNSRKDMVTMLVISLLEGGIIAAVSYFMAPLQFDSAGYWILITLSLMELVTFGSYLLLKYFKTIGLFVDFVLIAFYIFINGLLTFNTTSSGSILSTIGKYSPFSFVEGLLRSVLYSLQVSVIGVFVLCILSIATVFVTFILTIYHVGEKSGLNEV